MKKVMMIGLLGWFALVPGALAEEASPQPVPEPQQNAEAVQAEAAMPAQPQIMEVPKSKTPEAKQAGAQEPKPTHTKVSSGRSNYFVSSADKLGRGISNVGYSPLEIPYRIAKDIEEVNPLAAFGSGLLKGAGWGVLRLGAGVFDVATFFIPTKPIIRDFNAGWWSA